MASENESDSEWSQEEKDDDEEASTAGNGPHHGKVLRSRRGVSAPQDGHGASAGQDNDGVSAKQDDDGTSASQDDSGGNLSVGESEGELSDPSLSEGDEEDHGSRGSTATSDDDDGFDDQALDDDVLEVYAQSVVNEDTCMPSCVEDKFDLVLNCVTSIAEMSKAERKASVLAVLALLSGTAKPAKSRLRFAYALPLVGECCRGVFCACYQMASASLDRMRAQVTRGAFAPIRHKNKKNKNAATIDLALLKAWFREFGASAGQVIPVGIRRKKNDSGVVTNRVSTEKFTLLPSYFTWDRLHHELTKFAEKEFEKQRQSDQQARPLRQNKRKRSTTEEKKNEECVGEDDAELAQQSELEEGSRVIAEPEPLTLPRNKKIDRVLPDVSTMRRLLKKHCPEIKIGSPRSNVCDVCFIYTSSLSKRPSTEETERFGMHTELAKQMRELYKNELAAASDDHIVLTMDFAQNLTIPSAAETPSEWYFLSLIAISVFGIHDAHLQEQTNYIYSERKGKKGPNEVISMLNRHLHSRTPSSRTLTVFADNCGGQNKNNFVLKYLLVLAHAGIFKEVNYFFFVKGHTKNGCDRGFGIIKRKVAKNTIYTMKQLFECVSEASVSGECALLEDEEAPFQDYKSNLNELYRNIKGIQRYQMFQMRHDMPGSIICRLKPNDFEPDVFDVRCKYDGMAVSSGRALQLLDDVPSLPVPPVNAEKVSDIYKKVLKYIPAEFRDDPFYQAPTADQQTQSQIKKKARVTKRPRLPKKNTD